MGGNVIFDGHRAEPIDLRKPGADLGKIRESLFRLIGAIDTADLYHLSGGDVLFEQRLAGSSKFLFTRDKDSLLKYKSTFGDIDFMVGEAEEDIIAQNILGAHSVDYRLLGFKKTVGQIVSLWYIRELDQNVQIDFILVPSSYHGPSDWARLMHSADWEDQIRGVKGFAHKYIFRAMCAMYLVEGLMGKKGQKFEMGKTSLYAVSPHGFRKKLEYQGHTRLADHGYTSIYTILSTKETGFSHDIRYMLDSLIGEGKVSRYDPRIQSLTGMLKIIRENCSLGECRAITNGMVELLFGEGAQRLYRDDHGRDLAEKMNVIHVLRQDLGTNTPTLQEKLTKYLNAT